MLVHLVLLNSSQSSTPPYYTITKHKEIRMSARGREGEREGGREGGKNEEQMKGGRDKKGVEGGKDG